MDTALPLRSPLTRILIARGLRAFGDGFVSLLLPLYLLELGFGPLQVGIIATATLLRLRPADARRRPARAPLPLPDAAARRRGADGGDRRSAFARVHDFWPLLLDRHRRHAQSVERRRQRVPAARARGAVARRPAIAQRTAAFARYSLVGALVAAFGSLAAALPADARADSDGLSLRAVAAGDVRRLCAAGRAGRRSPTAACPQARNGRRVADASRRCANRSAGLRARGAVQPRCVRRRLRRPVDGRAVAVPAVRPVARGRRRPLLLDRHADRTVVPRRGAHRAPHRARQHDGVHAPSVQPVPDRDPVHAAMLSCVDRAAARAQRAVADGRADAQLVCDGDRHAGRAPGGGEHHRRCRAASRRPRARSWPGYLLGVSTFGWPLLIAGALKIVYDLLLLACFGKVRPPEEAP